MKKLAWFVLGIAGGFVLAHLVDKDPRGHEVMADLDARISEFTDRIGDAYREQEARLTEVVDAAAPVLAASAASVAAAAHAASADAASPAAPATPATPAAADAAAPPAPATPAAPTAD